MEFKMDIERELAYAVVDAFEDLLDEKGIEITSRKKSAIMKGTMQRFMAPNTAI